MKLLSAIAALCLLPCIASAQSAGPPTFLQGQPLSSAMLNNAFKSVVRLNGLTMVGSCQGNSAPNGNGAATITVTCPGAGIPSGANGSIQINNGGLFQGVTLNGDASMDSTGLLTLNTVPVLKGGTGSTTAAGARVNLGISTVGGTGAYADLTGKPTLGTIAATALPAGPLVGSNGTALTSIPAISGDATLDVATGILTLAPVAVPKGGTGAAIFGAHQILLGQGTSPVTTTTGGVAAQVLTSNGPNADPTWQAAAGGGTGLSPIANNTLLANTSGFSANPVSTQLTAMLDTIGAVQGSVLERGASGWQPIVPGTAGNCWTSNGANADPTWQSCAGGTAFSGTGGVVGVDANGQPFIFSLNNLTVSTGTGSGILSAGSGGGGTGGGGTEFVNPQTSTTYTVVSGDATTLTTLSNASAIAVTLPQPGSTVLAGWFADYSNIGTAPATFTPTTSSIDGTASIVLYPGQGIRIVSDGVNYFTQRGGMIPAQVGPLINVLSASGAAADADTFPVVQGGTTATKQNFGAVWTWVSGHLPNYKLTQVTTATGFTLDANTHNGKMVTVTAPITVSLPSTLAAVGVGFRTVIFNQSGGAITLSNAGAGWGAWATSSGALSIPNGQVAIVSVIQPVSAGVVYANISNTGTGGGGTVGGFPRVSGRYYGPAVSFTGTIGITAGRLYALPMRLVAGTYRGLAFNIAGSGPNATTACRQALYADNGSGAPGALLAENVASIPASTVGTEYNDFTGGDYTATTDANVWVAFVCSTINLMQVTVATQDASTQAYQETQLGSPVPVGTSGADAGIWSSTITTYPATSLAATNAGNFGAVTYSGSLGIPIGSVRAR